VCVRLREDEVVDTLVQRRRDGRAALRMIASSSRSKADAGTESSPTLPWREMDSNLYGAFPVK
jgi:hypothetical protein